MALVILAGLLAAMNQFVFSIAESWTKDRDRFTFAQHARAVSRHVGEMFHASTNAARASGVDQGKPTSGEVRMPDASTAELITFDLPGGDRIFSWPDAPLPEVHCAIGWNREDGLVVYYKSRLEEDFDEVKFRVAVLSPFVTELSYDYYDEQRESWTVETDLKKEGTSLTTPRRLRLRFQRGNQDITEFVMVPLSVSEGVPVY
jgi:hypothetical protein